MMHLRNGGRVPPGPLIGGGLLCRVDFFALDGSYCRVDFFAGWTSLPWMDGWTFLQGGLL